MSCLIDTNVLVYRFDPRDHAKQARAAKLIREVLENGTGRIAHQCLVEFIAATTRPLREKPTVSLLTPAEATWEGEELMRQFEVLYPSEGQVRLAIRGWQAYGLNWFDAHLWSFAEFFGIKTLYSEDFQHGRGYGLVRAVNPFMD